MIPKLTELIDKRVVLVLGAGASYDYGLPLWGQLKADLLEILCDRECSDISESPSAKWWIEALNRMDDSVDTVDSIATAAPDEHFDLFRSAIALILTKYELQAPIETTIGWVESLAEKFAAAVYERYPDEQSVRNAAANLSIVTLNYDRVFDVRFYSNVLKNFKEKLPHQREYLKRFNNTFSRIGRVMHPHGCIGSTGREGESADGHTYLNATNGYQVSYGDSTRIEIYIKDGRLPFIAPVDDLEGADNPTYKRANELLRVADIVLCIGLSPVGIERSYLDFSDAKIVYYSGKEKIAGNFQALNMRAAEIVAAL